jgi:hypothetical protein
MPDVREPVGPLPGTWAARASHNYAGKQSLAQFQELGKTPPTEATCCLLLDMGRLYHDNGSYVEACRVLFNTREMAEQINLAELMASADALV